MDKMLKEKMLNEYKEDIIKKGVRIEVDFKELTVEQFAEKLLIIINNKSSNSSVYNIVDVRTFYGTNIIEITTHHEEAVMHMVKQLVDDYEQITVTEKITVVDLTDMDTGYQLEKLGLIDEDEEIVIVGK